MLHSSSQHRVGSQFMFHKWMNKWMDGWTDEQMDDYLTSSKKSTNNFILVDIYIEISYYFQFCLYSCYGAVIFRNNMCNILLICLSYSSTISLSYWIIPIFKYAITYVWTDWTSVYSFISQWTKYPISRI